MKNQANSLAHSHEIAKCTGDLVHTQSELKIGRIGRIRRIRPMNRKPRLHVTMRMGAG